MIVSVGLPSVPMKGSASEKLNSISQVLQCNTSLTPVLLLMPSSSSLPHLKHLRFVIMIPLMLEVHANIQVMSVNAARLGF